MTAVWIILAVVVAAGLVVMLIGELPGIADTLENDRTVRLSRDDAAVAADREARRRAAP